MRGLICSIPLALLLCAPLASQCGTQTISGYTSPSAMGWDHVQVVGQGGSQGCGLGGRASGRTDSPR